MSVWIDISSPIVYGIDDLYLQCSPIGTYIQITHYSVIRNGHVICEMSYDIQTNSTDIQWKDKSFEERAVVSFATARLPYGNARIRINITSSRVLCGDEGKYQCEIYGTLPKPTKSKSNDVDVLITCKLTVII